MEYFSIRYIVQLTHSSHTRILTHLPLRHLILYCETFGQSLSVTQGPELT